MRRGRRSSFGPAERFAPQAQGFIPQFDIAANEER
jgi:hypothetical protein